MTERKNSEKRIASNNKWTNAHYDRVNLALPKGQKDRIQAHAAALGESVNGFVSRVIMEAMERDGGAAAAPGVAPVERVLAEMPAGGPQQPAETTQGAGGILVSPDTLEAAQRAAGRTGESVAAFVARAVAEQGKRDDNAFKMGINPA